MNDKQELGEMIKMGMDMTKIAIRMLQHLLLLLKREDKDYTDWEPDSGETLR